MNAYRLILTDGRTRTPLAVLVEDGHMASYRLATQCGTTLLPEWSTQWLSSDNRSPSDAWALASWQQWLDDWASASSTHRLHMLERMEQHAPDLIVEPTQIDAAFHSPATASRWLSTDQLHSRRELAAADIAGIIAGTRGQAYYRPELEFTELHITLAPAFAVESQTRPSEPPTPRAGSDEQSPWPEEPITTTTLIQTFDTDTDLTAFRQRWEALQSDSEPINGALIGLTTFQRPVETTSQTLVAPMDTPYLRMLVYAFRYAH